MSRRGTKRQDSGPPPVPPAPVDLVPTAVSAKPVLLGADFCSAQSGDNRHLGVLDAQWRGGGGRDMDLWTWAQDLGRCPHSVADTLCVTLSRRSPSLGPSFLS